MKNAPLDYEEVIDRFYTYIDRAIIIKVGYLLLIFGLRWVKIYDAVDILFILVSLMALTSLIIGILVEKFSMKPKNIINILFGTTLFDLFLLTIVIYYLGGIEYMYYTFYIILSFIIFPRGQAIAITCWIILLFWGVVALRYFQLVPVFFSPIPKEEQTFYNFQYVATTIFTYVLTFSFLGYFSHGFFKMMAKRLILSRETQKILEEEKASLEIRVQARKRELELERESLEKRVQDRTKEIELEKEELEKRAKELEKFKKVSQGREIKMTNLEEEIKRLKERGKK